MLGVAVHGVPVARVAGVEGDDLPPGDRLTTGDAERWLPPFDPQAEDALVAFLKTLTMGFGR